MVKEKNESKLTKCHDAVINEFSHSIQTQIIELLKDREVSRFFMLLFQLLKIIDKKIDENIYLKTDKSVTKKMYSNIVLMPGGKDAYEAYQQSEGAIKSLHYERWERWSALFGECLAFGRAWAGCCFGSHEWAC